MDRLVDTSGSLPERHGVGVCCLLLNLVISYCTEKSVSGEEWLGYINPLGGALPTASRQSQEVSKSGRHIQVTGRGAAEGRDGCDGWQGAEPRLKKLTLRKRIKRL